ncbi:hypothetical protein [Nocardiopsis sp. CC223A]|uniref:hypothetical protein n=1 Tax=Nocardiopsis sp. CC223A TaxID=3044051 RepID=UPI00278BB988|nr:hypothetical protein [Nocardiopsis sp. CC223A]
MGHRKVWELALGVITPVLAGFWALPGLLHNRQRRHSAIGRLSPVEFGKRPPSTVV